jgi:hypothetical protein
MAFAFPLTLAQFLDLLPVNGGVPTLDDPNIRSENGGGEIMISVNGPRLWKGTFSLAEHAIAREGELVAMAELLRQQGGSFLCSPRHRAGPAADPTGSILGAAAPTFSTVNANLRDVNIAGLPVAYKISVGDFVSFQYGTSPVRYALHRFARGGTANGSGAITGAEVYPPMRPGVVNGQAITLVNPVCKAILVDDGSGWGQAGLVSIRSGSFSWRQTLR